MARIDKLWIKPRHRAPMESRDELHLLAGKGIEGNADAEGSGSSDANGVWRQVTVISADRWELVRTELGDVDPALRRANVMVSGLDLRDSRGKILRLGPARIQLRGETRPCKFDGRSARRPACRARRGLGRRRLRRRDDRRHHSRGGRGVARRSVRRR